MWPSASVELTRQRAGSSGSAAGQIGEHEGGHRLFAVGAIGREPE